VKHKLLIILIFLSLNLFGQKSDIENLINQIAKDEVPDKFKYYFLVSKSIEQKKINDSLDNYEFRDLKVSDNNFLKNFINIQPKNETIDWINFNLNKVKFVSNENYYTLTLSPPKTKKVKFVKNNIDQKKYENLIKNKEPYTLILKKKWLWNKKRIWKNKKFYNDFLENWKTDDINNPEEMIYYHFSKPIFSENNKYALVTVFIQKSCNGRGFTALYKNVNGIWKNVKEYNKINSETFATHIKCEDIRMIEYE
jgi:hypothetical protein